MTVARQFTLASAVCLLLAPVAATAQEFDGQIAARKGQMFTLGISLGVLGGMARGNMEYDAETAQAAADNLVAVSQIDQRFTWPEGSDNFSLDTTRALPTIWEDLDGFTADWVALGEASLAMQAAAGGGAEAIGGAMRDLGAACQACHEDYREPDS